MIVISLFLYNNLLRRQLCLHFSNICDLLAPSYKLIYLPMAYPLSVKIPLFLFFEKLASNYLQANITSFDLISFITRSKIRNYMNNCEILHSLRPCLESRSTEFEDEIFITHFRKFILNLPFIIYMHLLNLLQFIHFLGVYILFL